MSCRGKRLFRRVNKSKKKDNFPSWDSGISLLKTRSDPRIMDIVATIQPALEN